MVWGGTESQSSKKTQQNIMSFDHLALSPELKPEENVARLAPGDG